jgi:hypothetical protein
MEFHSRYTGSGGLRRSWLRRERETFAMGDQEWAGGGRWKRGGKSAEPRGGTGIDTAAARDAFATPGGAGALATAKVEWHVETTGGSLVDLNAGIAGSHGVEKPAEPPGALSGCACVIATPIATISAKANAKLAHLRTIG